MRCTKDSLLSTESVRLLNAIFHRTFVPFREAGGVPRGVPGASAPGAFWDSRCRWVADLWHL